MGAFTTSDPTPEQLGWRLHVLGQRCPTLSEHRGCFWVHRAGRPNPRSNPADDWCHGISDAVSAHNGASSERRHLQAVPLPSRPVQKNEMFTAITVQRHQLADFLDSLTSEQWDAPSLCARWRVRDVLGHL
ncbi:MAG: maleylpyruvate isomerase N-terminal domain-containing protein, partial [Acidimicrobiia bacterium]